MPRSQRLIRGRRRRTISGCSRSWDACRAAVAGASLDDTFEDVRWGAMSLRWLYVHMIREYAGHNGHADLLRERVDGLTFG
jgi:Protein of unknown function (DUF664)